MSKGFARGVEFIIPKGKIKKEHKICGRAVKITFDNGDSFICGDEQLIWVGEWVRAIDCCNHIGIINVERVPNRILYDVTLRGFKHVFNIKVGDRILTVHNMPTLPEGTTIYGGGVHEGGINFYFYKPYDNIIKETHKVFKDKISPFTDKGLSVEIGGAFEEIGGVDEAIGGGNQKVGTDNK